MSIIRKKCWPEYFEKILSGQKNYDLRINDFEVREGDTLILEEYDPKSKTYSGRSVSRQVTFVGKFKLDEMFWPKAEIEEKGLLVLSLK